MFLVVVSCLRVCVCVCMCVCVCCVCVFVCMYVGFFVCCICICTYMRNLVLHFPHQVVRRVAGATGSYSCRLSLHSLLFCLIKQKLPRVDYDACSFQIALYSARCTASWRKHLNVSELCYLLSALCRFIHRCGRCLKRSGPDADFQRQ